MGPLMEIGNMIGGWLNSLKKIKLSENNRENKKTCGRPGSDNHHPRSHHHRTSEGGAYA